MRLTPDIIIQHTDLVVEKLTQAGVKYASERIAGILGYCLFYADCKVILNMEKAMYQRTIRALNKAKQNTKLPKTSKSRTVTTHYKTIGNCRRKLNMIERRFNLVSEYLDKKLIKFPDVDIDVDPSNIVITQSTMKKQWLKHSRHRLCHKKMISMGWLDMTSKKPNRKK